MTTSSKAMPGAQGDPRPHRPRRVILVADHQLQSHARSPHVVEVDMARSARSTGRRRLAAEGAIRHMQARDGARIALDLAAPFHWKTPSSLSTRHGAGTLSAPDIAHAIESEGDWHGLLMPIRRAAVGVGLGRPADDLSQGQAGRSERLPRRLSARAAAARLSAIAFVARGDCSCAPDSRWQSAPPTHGRRRRYGRGRR